MSRTYKLVRKVYYEQHLPRTFAVSFFVITFHVVISISWTIEIIIMDYVLPPLDDVCGISSSRDWATSSSWDPEKGEISIGHVIMIMSLIWSWIIFTFTYCSILVSFTVMKGTFNFPWCNAAAKINSTKLNLTKRTEGSLNLYQCCCANRANG